MVFLLWQGKYLSSPVMESACTTVDMASLQRSLPEEASGIEATVNADNLVLGPHLYPSSLACENSMDHGFEASRKVVFKLKGIECCACASSIEKKNTIQKAIQDSGFDVTAVEEDPECQSITCRLRVKGMTCTACSSSLESQLKQIEGVKKAVVALAIEEAEVQYDPALVNYKKIIKVVADTGFEAELISAGNESSRIHLRLENSMIYSKENMELMQCSLMELAGVNAVEIDAREKRIIISYDPSETGPRCFIDTINNAGFKASVHADLSGPDRSKDVKDYKHHFLWSCAFTIPIFLFAMVFMYIPILKDTLEKKVVNTLTVGMLVRWALSTPVQFGFGRRFYRGAYNALRHGSANMDVLIALGTNAAYFYSVYTVLRAATSSKGFKESDFFETSAMLISFILLGKYLEALAKGKTSEAISKLIELQPECATLLIRDHNGEILSEEVISTQLIQKKDVLKIVPGKKTPTDGVVVWGQSHVNESMITGEARPVPKRPGDKIIGGTVNESGVLHVQATRVGSETALSQIVRLVKAAQMAKAPVQKYADRISEYFVPFVVLSAVVTWLAWFGAGICGSYPKSWIPTYMDEFELALQFGISVLVIACPCALGLATPTAVMVATGKGASQGILIKSGQALESTHKIRCIVFDKTGTLTYGRPVVTHTKLFKNLPIADFYKLVAAVEVNSVHPLARAIVQHANSLEAEAPQGGGCPLVEDFESIPGRGVCARVEDKEVLIGNWKLMEGLTVTLSAEVAQHLKHMEDMAETAVIVSSEHDVIGIIAVSDSVRPEAAGAIALLQSWGVQSVMVTGDNWGTAQAVARELGIDNFIAEAEPSTKADKITDLQRTGMVVGVVGDGINDSPALVAADVGMAIGAGTDVAIEAADIVLMRSNLEDVLTAIDLSKKTFSKIKMNYVWALGYNVLALPLAAGVLFPFIRLRLPPWVAGAAMAISSVSVVCSSLLLRSYKRPKRLASLKQRW